MIGRILGAIQFLTILPLHGKYAEPGRAALFFPLVGAWLGFFGAGLYGLAQPHLSSSLAALLVVIAGMLLTGGLHEDGLADVADAFRAGRGADRILAILKDSRIGTYGGLAILGSVLLRWQAIDTIPAANLTGALVASQAVSRAAMVALAWTSRPVGTGLGAAFCLSLTSPAAVLAILQGAAFALLCGPLAALWIVVAAAVIVAAAHSYFHTRIGGVTGDCLGAVSQWVEIAVLLVLSCRSCSW